MQSIWIKNWTQSNCCHLDPFCSNITFLGQISKLLVNVFFTKFRARSRHKKVVFLGEKAIRARQNFQVQCFVQLLTHQAKKLSLLCSNFQGAGIEGVSIRLGSLLLIGEKFFKAPPKHALLN